MGKAKDLAATMVKVHGLVKDMQVRVRRRRTPSPDLPESGE